MAFPLRYMRVTGNIAAIVPDFQGLNGSGVPDGVPDSIPLSGDVEFTMNLDDGDYVLCPADPEGPSIKVVAPTMCKLDVDGYITYGGRKYVELFTPDEHTYPKSVKYTVRFLNMKRGMNSVNIRSFSFDAVPGANIDLATVARVPGTQSSPVTVGPAGAGVQGVRLDGDDLIFTISNGIGDMPAITLPGIGDIDSYVAATEAAADEALENRNEAAVFASTANQRANAAAGSATAAAGSATTAATHRDTAKGYMDWAFQFSQDANATDARVGEALDATIGARDAALQYRDTAKTHRDDTVALANQVSGQATAIGNVATAVNTARDTTLGYRDTANTKAGEAAASAVTAKTEADRAAGYVGGVADGAITNAKVAANAAIDRSKIAGLQASLDSKPTMVDGMIARTSLLMSPESPDATTIPYYMNDIAFNNLRGGSAQIYIDGVENTAIVKDLLFHPNSSAVNIPVTGVSQVVIEVTLCKAFSYGTKIGYAVNAGWRAKDVKIEAWTGSAWELVSNQQNVPYGEFVTQKNFNPPNSLAKLRYTFSNFLNTTGSFRVGQLFVLAFDSQLGAGPFMTRDGGDVYGHITGIAPVSVGHLTRKDYVDTKVASTGSANVVYANNGSGVPTPLQYSSSPTATTVAFRTTGGVLSVGEPTVSTHATTKGYVDTQIATRAAATALASKADLDGNGKIPQSQLPAVALTDFLGTVANQAAMLALTGQRGDWCNRSDTGTEWQLIAEPSTALASWQEKIYPASPVQSVAGRSGAVALSKGDVGLGNVDNTADSAKPISSATQAALSAKADTSALTSGLSGKVSNASGQSLTLWKGTQAQYDAIASKDANTVYVVTAS